MEQLKGDILSNQGIVAISIIAITTIILIVYRYKKKSQRKLTPDQKRAFELLGKGNIPEFKKHMDENEINPNLQDFSNLYLLHTAVGLSIKKEQEGLEAISYLISKGAIINCQDQSGRTPIFMASHWGLRTVVDLLISYKADINETIYKSGYPMNPLYTVLLKSSFKMSWFLIQRGSSLDIIEDIHKKTKKFKLVQAQLDFIEKCKLTLQRIENKKKLCLTRIYQQQYLKRQQNEEAVTQSNDEQPSTLIAMLNYNEFREICKNYL